MTRRLLLPALFILIVNMALAQRFQGGILAGYNATQVEGDSYKGYHKPGILAGAFVQTDIAPAVFAGLEIKYSQKGARNRINPKDEEPDKYIMRLGYIDIPVFVGFRASDRSAVVGGISAGYLVHAKEFDEYGEFVREDQNAFNDFDLQPFVGFQFDMLDRLKLDLRIAYSVLPIRGLPGEDATNYYWLNNQFNNVISLAFYYRLDR
ncbi:outer membrane beta-barrel protein [Maribellus comscasis]|uniref:Outer membrane beta-barrel protein n=1 Tax=Maribellus comscasis TaxID=2681766 RepID=A0A6I6JXC9_9BACT|nr:porin family protein [Maribellus comscasis]QGY43783.1 outer membrane beta-barrel protein [Maribellus comscasis]